MSFGRQPFINVLPRLALAPQAYISPSLPLSPCTPLATLLLQQVPAHPSELWCLVALSSAQAEFVVAMGLGNGALAAICLLGCVCIAVGEAVTASTSEEKNYYPSTPTPVTPSAPAPSSSSPVSPSYSPPYSSPSTPAPISSSSPVTPSSPTYSPPYSPSYSPPTSPAPSGSSPVTPSTPSYSPPYSPSYSPPTSPAPSGSSPISAGPALSPVSTPYTPSYSPPSSGSPPCPPLASWFTPGSSGSPPGWWKDQLAAEDKRRSSLPTSEKAAHTDNYDPTPSTSSPTVPSLGPSTSPTIPLLGPTTAPTAVAPAAAFPGTCDSWASTSSNLLPTLLSFITTILDLFGGSSGSIFGSSMTLYQGLTNKRPDSYGALLRHGSAAILNAYSNRSYPYSPMQVKASFNAALFSEQAAAVQAVRFENANLGYGVRH